MVDLPLLVKMGIVYSVGERDGKAALFPPVSGPHPAITRDEQRAEGKGESNSFSLFQRETERVFSVTLYNPEYLSSRR
jgi:hypothetical protein